MAEYKRLTKAQEYIMIGRTYCMWRDGRTNAEIAECLKRPIKDVNGWVEMCKFAATKFTPEEDAKVRAIMGKKRVA